jgi:CRP/FNR family transcriptional regulator
MADRLTERHFPFLAELSQDGRRQMDRALVSRAPRGKRLLRQGDFANGAYLVLAGELRVYYLAADGREATLYRVEPGGTCVLALTSTFSDEPYPAWVEAGEKGSTFARLPGAELRRLLDTESAFRSFVFRIMSGRIFELMLALEEAGTAHMEERVARYLAKRCEGGATEVRATQARIASELGTAREVVFRALRSLAQRNLIETGRMRVRVLDVSGLRAAGGKPISPK